MTYDIQRSMTPTIDRTLPMPIRTLRAYYDLAVSPLGFNIVDFLYLAEIERIHRKFDFLELVVVANAGDGFRADLAHYALEEKRWRLHHIVLPAHRLLPSCRRAVYYPDRDEARQHFDAAVPVFPSHYTVERPVADYLDSGILLARYANKRFGTLRAPQGAVERVTRWIESNAGGRKPIVITLRQSSIQPKRNSKVTEWVRFARSLNPKVYCVIFVPDTETVFSGSSPNLDGYLTFEPAAIDIELRLALYECAYVSLHVDSGPAVCCMLDDRTRCLRFKMIAENNPAIGPRSFIRRGYEKDMQWANCTSLQRTVWEDDTFEIISREFAILAERIEAELPVKLVPIPSPTSTMTRLIAGQNFADAIRLADLLLKSDPTDLEMAFLRATALLRSGAFEDARSGFHNLTKISGARSTAEIPLAVCLWKTGSVHEAVSLLANLANDSATPISKLYEISTLLLDMGEQATALPVISRVMQIDPDSPRSAHLFARYLQGTNINAAQAIKFVTPALRRWPNDPQFPAILADCYARYGKFKEAIRFQNISLRLRGYTTPPSIADDHFADWADLALWLLLNGERQTARAHLKKLLSSVNQATSVTPTDSVTHLNWLATKARLHFLLDERQEVHDCLKTLVETNGPRPYRYECNGAAPTYLPNTSQRLDRMRQLIDGRDVFIFCPGKSIAAMEKFWPAYSTYNVCLVAVNRLSLFESGFLSNTNDKIEILIQTHYHTIRAQKSDLIDFLARKYPNLFITNSYSLDRLGKHAPSRRALEAAFGEKLLYHGPINRSAPSAPHDPLRCAPINTLSTLIKLIAIAQPKRIFLFGADGGNKPGERDRPYYRDDMLDYGMPFEDDLDHIIGCAHAADTIRFNCLFELELIAAEHLYRIRRPNIYNVSPQSTIDVFPRLTYEKALTILDGTIRPNLPSECPTTTASRVLIPQ